MTLAPARGDDRGPDADGPVFLVGWWRSGTTFFWNLLRDVDRYTGYFEPFHEHLPLYLEEDPDPPSDPTHVGVEDYWTEYRRIETSRLEAAREPWFGRERFHMGAEDDAPGMRAYLDLLVEEAPARPVLKIVRGTFRVPWLGAAYPDATIVHVVRDPRCVWTSMVGRDAATDDPVPGERHGFFHALVRIATELGVHRDAHLYRTFFAVWVRAYRTVEGHADATWWYDDAVRDPEAWFLKHLVEPGWLDAAPDVPVHEGSLEPGLHTKSWYLDHEARALTGSEPSADGGDDPRLRFLLEENRHLDDEMERLQAELRRVRRRYERLLAYPPLRPLVRLVRRVRSVLG